MKRHILFSIVLFVVILLSAKGIFATNTLELIGGQVVVNSTASISVIMANNDDIVAFQIDIPIPAELSYIAGTATYDSARITDHRLSDTLLPTGVLRIIGYSMSNDPFIGSTGELVSFQLQASSLPGTYSLNFTTAVLGNDQSINVLTGTQNGSLTVMGPDISTSSSSVDFGRVPLLGTNDRYVTIYNTGNTDLDITQIASSSQYFTVIGSTATTISGGSNSSLHLHFSSEVKNTYDDTLTIHSDDADQGKIEIYLSAVAFAVNELHTGNMSAFSGDYTTLEFAINNMEPIVGFQFDLNLPSSLSFAEDSAFLSDRKANHKISANMINNNTLRVVAYSEDNQKLIGYDGAVLELGFNIEGIGGYYGISISNVVVGDTLGLNAVSDFTGGSLQIGAADISVTSSVNFGDVSILGSSTESLTINNYGNDTLEVGSLQFSNSSFSSTQALPLLINPSSSSPINITFSNATETAVTGTVRLFSNDPDENPTTVNLSGNAYIPNYISVKDSMYSYGDTMYVDINVDNLESFTGFQFDLNYSDSLTFLANLTQLGQRATNHAIQVNEVDSNTVRLFAYSLSQTEISGNSGSIVRLPFVGDSAVYGSILITLDSALLGNAQSQDILWGMNNNSIIIARPQEIVLQAGWNIFSTNVSPYYMNIDSILYQQMSDGNLVKVMDEEGGFLQNIEVIGWMNTIGDLKITDGYYLKVVDTDTIACEGDPVIAPVTIPLSSGWNIMGYPLISEQDALQALQSLINNGTLYKIMDEQGGFIQSIEGLGWLNTIGDFEPGEGYYLKVNSSTNLTLDESASKSKLQLNENIPLTYFSPIQGEAIYNPMNFVLKLENETSSIITIGDEIAIFDGEFCVGAAVISENSQEYISIVTSMNDNDLDGKDGFASGNEFNFRFWNNETNELYANVTPDNQNSTTIFQPLETYVGNLSTNAIGIKESDDNKNGILNIIVAPNPVKNKLKLYCLLLDEGYAWVHIYDASGKELLSNKYEEQKIGWNSIIINTDVLRSGLFVGKIVFTTHDNKISTGHFKFVKM